MKCEIQAAPHPAADALTLNAVLRALADPQRRAILRAIEAEPGIACAALLPDAPRSTVSVHLKVLRKAGLIEQGKKGQLVLNRPRPDGAVARFPELVAAVRAADS